MTQIKVDDNTIIDTLDLHTCHVDIV